MNNLDENDYLDENKFEIEGDIEDNDELEIEEDEEEFEPRRRGMGTMILMIVFIILFINAAGLFVYYQFYLGEGKWDLSLKKRTGSIIVMKELESERDSLFFIADSLMNNRGIETETFPVTEEPVEEVVEPQEKKPSKIKGEVYEIQIGAFRTIDLGKYKSNMRSIDVDASSRVDKVVIGSFRNFDDACSFRNDMKKIGFKDAFIVKKVNGNRVDFEGLCPGDN